MANPSELARGESEELVVAKAPVEGFIGTALRACAGQDLIARIDKDTGAITLSIPANQTINPMIGGSKMMDYPHEMVTVSLDASDSHPIADEIKPAGVHEIDSLDAGKIADAIKAKTDAMDKDCLRRKWEAQRDRLDAWILAKRERNPPVLFVPWGQWTRVEIETTAPDYHYRLFPNGYWEIKDGDGGGAWTQHGYSPTWRAALSDAKAAIARRISEGC